jgi:hypothetical protein
LENVQASHLLTPFWDYGGEVIYTRNCPNITFENCEFDGSGKEGIMAVEDQVYKENPNFIEDQIQINIINCYIHNNSGSALNFYTQNNVKFNVLIRDSRIINNNAFISHDELTDVSYEGDNIIKDNSPAGYKRISGKVLTPDGQPLPFADGDYMKVCLTYAGYSGYNQEFDYVPVESDGSFNIGSNLPEGDYFLRVVVFWEIDLFKDSEPLLVHVAKDRLTEQNIRLMPPVLKGQILKPDGTNFTCGENSNYDISLMDKTYALWGIF